MRVRDAGVIGFIFGLVLGYWAFTSNLIPIETRETSLVIIRIAQLAALFAGVVTILWGRKTLLGQAGGFIIGVATGSAVVQFFHT